MKSSEFLSIPPAAIRLMLIALMSQIWNGAAFSSGVLPCEFRDSVNITGGEPGPGETITFNNLKFTRNQYAELEYDIDSQTESKKVTAPYLRGCPCDIKPCIRLCYPFGTAQKIYGNKTRKLITSDAAKDLTHEVIYNNGETKTVHLNEEFPFVFGIFGLISKKLKLYATDEFTLTQSGHLHDGISHDQHEYCLVAYMYGDKLSLKAHVLYEEEDPPYEVRDIIYAIAMLTSVAFITATFFVYLFVPELRNVHGKCLLCYLTALMVGYSLMAFIKINGWYAMNPIVQRTIGYSTYFSLLSAFFWSNVISFDLNRSFQKKHFFKTFSEKRKFAMFLIYGWGVPLLLTSMTIALDHFEPFQQEFLPGIGKKTGFLKPAKDGKLSPFLYFYMVICIIYSINITYFILTALKIRDAQRDIIHITSQEESACHQSHLNNQRDNIILYCRLFIVMGVFWIFEGVTYLIEDPDTTNSLKNKGNIFIWIVDIWNLLQGAIIFGIFVMKRRVLNLIKKRLDTFRGRTNGLRHESGSTKTSTITESR